MKKILVIALALSSVKAFAWGPTGHRAVGEIAQKHLYVHAISKIAILTNGQSLAKISTWPDDIKSEPEKYSHTFNWHYTDWKIDQHHHDETQSEGKLIGALNEQIAVLKNPLAPQNKKLEALKFVVHFVGDLHQPLHVGNGVDRGGNNCKVIFHGQKTNLHALWDEGVINFTGLSFVELARFSTEGRSLNDFNNARTGSILDWAKESKTLRETIYPQNSNLYCRADGNVSAEDMPRLSYEYSYKFMPVIEEKIFKAGIRLAQILNDALR